MSTIFLSDVHLSAGRSLGRPDCYDRLSQASRDDLASFFTTLAAEDTVEEVVLVGDFLDTWYVPIYEAPPTYKEILENNPNIVEALSKLAQQKKVTYVRGNHDMTAWDAPNSDVIKGAINNSNFTMVDTYDKNGLMATHGHNYFVFNAEDVIDGHRLPLGFYITRFAATLAAHGKGATDAHDALAAIGHILTSGPSGVHVVQGIFSHFYDRLESIRLAVDDNYAIKMENGSTITCGEVKKLYSGMFETWEKKTGEGWFTAINTELGSIPALNPDLCVKTLSVLHCGYKGILFGHTHKIDNRQVYRDGEDPSNDVSIGRSLNTGTWLKGGGYPYIEVAVGVEWDAKIKRWHNGASVSLS